MKQILNVIYGKDIDADDDNGDILYPSTLYYEQMRIKRYLIVKIAER
jgi:hypothetical protein